MYSLRPYQNEDVEKLLQYSTAGCFNEQRTGKTPVAITVMRRRNLDRVLIVAPASMLYPWKQEWERWADTPATVCVGSVQHRLNIIDKWEHGALIISYGCLRKTARADGMIEYILTKKPEGCIADEAHRFKDHTTATAKAMYRMTKIIPYRLALTGTPATNKPADIYGILHWLYPEVWSSYWNFVDTNFRTYISYTGYGKHHKEIGEWLPGRREIIAYQLNRFTTQRKRKQVMDWLPEKDYQDIKLPATKAQLKYIKDLETVWETGEVVTQTVLDRLLRIRQICSAPEIVGLKGSSPKLDWVREYIEDYPERPIIIFTKFVGTITILSELLTRDKKGHGVIKGDVSIKARNELVNAFQAGVFNILIIQIDAGKEGLTLDRAEVEIFLDQFPPAADIQQAEDRFVSTTPERANKPHQIVRLMLDGTYDVELYKLVQQRADSIDVVNNYIKYLKGEKSNGNSNE